MAYVAGAAIVEDQRSDFEDEYNAGIIERTLTIGKRSVFPPTPGFSYLLVEYRFESVRPSTGALDVQAAPPWGVLDMPKTVRVQWTSMTIGCLSQSQDPEPILFSQLLLRDDTGVLLIASGHAPLKSDGTALTNTDHLPELTLRWVDVGCCGSGTVALRLSVAGEGTSVTALPGERMPVRIGGRDYVFMSSGTRGPAPMGTTCGFGFWSVYRSDFLIELNEDGSAPKGQ